MIRKAIGLAGVAVLAACAESDVQHVTVAVDAGMQAEAPSVIAALDAMPSITIAEPGTAGAHLVLTLQADGVKLELDRMSVLFDRRDMAFADTIDLGARDKNALAELIAVRLLATDLAASTAEDDSAKLEALRERVALLPGLIAQANPLSPLGEDLRTSYRQGLFQIAVETSDEADIEAITAFEKEEATRSQGVDGDDRYDRSRAWYYFASADHLRADLSVENQIAQAFSGFKDAQRPFAQDRQVNRQTLRSDQELVAARVRVGQLLHAIGTVREDEKLSGEAEFAFKSSAGFWFDATGSTAPFCFQVELGNADSIRCLSQDEAVLPELVAD